MSKCQTVAGVRVPREKGKPGRVSFMKDGEVGGWRVFWNGNLALRLFEEGGLWRANALNRIETGLSADTIVGPLPGYAIRRGSVPRRLRAAVGASWPTIGEAKAAIEKMTRGNE